MTERFPASPGTLTEAASKHYLASCGMKMPHGKLATTLAEVREAAQAIGYPLAAKLQSPAAAHKSDIGGVILRSPRRSSSMRRSRRCKRSRASVT